MVAIAIPHDAKSVADEYATAAAAYGRAIAGGAKGEANSMFARIANLTAELALRGQISSLIPLLDHDEPWVRRFAAGDVWRLAPARAESTLIALMGLAGPVSLGIGYRLAQLKEDEDP